MFLIVDTKMVIFIMKMMKRGNFNANFHLKVKNEVSNYDGHDFDFGKIIEAAQSNEIDTLFAFEQTDYKDTIFNRKTSKRLITAERVKSKDSFKEAESGFSETRVRFCDDLARILGQH